MERSDAMSDVTALTIGVMIPARNDATDLPRAVETVRAQVGVHIDSIVLSIGPSDDGTEQVAAGLASADARVVVIQNPSGRTPDALNLAIDALGTDIIVRVDARSELPSGYIQAAVEALLETGAGNVGAIQNPVGATAVEKAIAAAMRSPFGTGGAKYRSAQTRQPVDTAYLGVFRGDALAAVGGYDAAFTRNQDAELNIRLNRDGFEVWLDPALVVNYRPRPSLRALASQYWQYGWWRQLTSQKHARSLGPRQLIPPAMVSANVCCVLAGVTVSALWLVVPGLYAAVVVFAGFRDGFGSLTSRLQTAAALATMHFSWGAGFLVSWLRHRVLSSTLRR